MADTPKVTPKGKGGKSILKGKVGPVPVPVLIFAVVGVAVYLYLKRRAKTTSQTSAGTNSGTDTTGMSPFPSDSTGGGASGGGAGDLGSGLGTGTGNSTYNYYYGGGSSGTGGFADGGGGNTTTPRTSQPGQTVTGPPSSFFPGGSTAADQAINAGFPTAPNGALYGDYGLSGPNIFTPERSVPVTAPVAQQQPLQPTPQFLAAVNDPTPANVSAAIASDPLGAAAAGLTPNNYQAPITMPGSIQGGTQGGQTVTGTSTPPTANPQPALTTIPTLTGSLGGVTGPKSSAPVTPAKNTASSKTGAKVAPGKAGGRALN